MTPFVGRLRELETLETAYRSERLELVPVYGRRRIGKSELILHFIKGKRAVYFLGKKAPPSLQLREFMELAAESLDQPLLAQAAVSDWGKALELILKYRPEGAKLILVFDEFQWTAQASPELPSLLQALCDQEGRKGASLMVILCGSYMGFMEKEVLGSKSPLFGRRTAQILLQPFSYLEAAHFHPQMAITDRAMIYFLCGGIPYYLRFFAPSESIPMNIRKQLLNEFAALFREPDFLLREELKEIEKYCGILFALANGAPNAAQITAKTGISERHLHYYLQSLIQLGYVARKHPLTDQPPSPRHVRFVVDDPLLRFWFRFVYPHLAFLSQNGPERLFSQLIEPDLDAYFGLCFERLCREALPALYRQEGVLSAFAVGEYWDAETQIDVVGLRQDNRVDLAECKWGTARALPSVETELSDRMRRYPNPSNATLQGRIFCQRAPTKRTVASIHRWHTLDELYALPLPGPVKP
jgi:AAA+ ATPase superfamily predicted ATPase